MADAILITAADGTIVTVNQAFTGLTGYSRDELLGRRECEIRNGLQPPQFYDDVFLTVQRKGYWSGTSWSRRKNGAVYREWRSVRAVREEGGAITHYVMVCHEVQSSSNGQSSAESPLAG
jgi:PAS domain S-box-containing protein